MQLRELWVRVRVFLQSFPSPFAAPSVPSHVRDDLSPAEQALHEIERMGIR